MNTSSLEIRLLGPLEVVLDGQPVPVTASRRDALLAVLALRCGRIVAVDELVDALWGTELPSSPRNALQHHVTRLRATLGRDSIVATTDGYGLQDAEVDALVFEEQLRKARQALERADARVAAAAIARATTLWRGPALQGLPDTPWVTAEARRLEALRLDALEEEFEVALLRGEHGLAPQIRRAVDESPYRERLWAQLMLALYRSGRQADALETFQEARTVLAEQLGLEPGPELQRLQTAILAHDPAIAAAPVRRHGNLPAPVTSFVNRAHELRYVVELLRQHRLVTVTGPPGVGKSRLALEAARSVENEFEHGIFFVDLGRAGGPEDVARLVAHALDVDDDERLERAVTHLRDEQGILFLDGCGRVVEAAARVAQTVLAQCAAFRVLATSREVFGLAGEARVTLAPLGSHGVELFAERARAARPGFELTSEAAPVVDEICRRVDGLPLAIELAAARVNTLAPSEILVALDRRGVAHDALQSLVDWSYDLLHGDEKTLLHLVSVYRGGASLPSLVTVAETFGLDEMTVTQLIGALADKSIATVSFPRDGARYDLLTTVREYALERLEQMSMLGDMRRAHAESFARIADLAKSELRGQAWREWMQQLQVDHDNFWAALAYARDASEPALAARLATGLGWYFGLAERVSEGRAFVEAALAPGEAVPLPLRVELLGYLCYLATEEDDLDAAVEAGESALVLASTGDAPWGTALVRLALAFAYARRGPHDRALRLAEEARAAFDELDDDWGAASSLVTGALAATFQGDIPSATALASEAARRHGSYEVGSIPAALLEAWLADRGGDADGSTAAYRRALADAERAGFADHESFALAGLGSIAFAAGSLDEAEASYRRALAVADDASESWLVAHASAGLAQVLAARGDADAAAALYRDVIAWSEQPRRRLAREALFLALAGDPSDTARTALDAAAA